MANRKAVLTRLVHTEKGHRYCPVVFDQHGNAKRGIVMIGGEERRFDYGDYYVRTYKGRRMMYEHAGYILEGALCVRQEIENRLAAE